MAALTHAELVAPASWDTDADPSGEALRLARIARKGGLYDDLVAVGVSGVQSWATGSVPSSLVEVYAWSLTDYDIQRAYTALGQLSSTAEDVALTTVSDEVYGNERIAGETTVCRILLTDAAGAGPYRFSPSSVSFSAGRGGLRFDGFDFDGSGQLTLPRSGTVYVYCRAEAAGAAYSQLALNAVNFPAKGALPGVTIANDATWLTFAGAVAGTDDESDAALRVRNAAKWGILSERAPTEDGYRYWALTAAGTQVTRARPLTNLDPLDPQRVDVIVAGPAGAVAGPVVATVQNYIAPNEYGGDGLRAPAGVRCVVSSAANKVISVTAALRVQGSYNTAAFQAQVAADFAALAAATEIGGGQLGLVSAERVLGVLVYRAGLSPGIILDVSSFALDDVALKYYEVPVFSLSLTWVSV